MSVTVFNVNSLKDKDLSSPSDLMKFTLLSLCFGERRSGVEVPFHRSANQGMTSHGCTINIAVHRGDGGPVRVHRPVAAAFLHQGGEKIHNFSYRARNWIDVPSTTSYPTH